MNVENIRKVIAWIKEDQGKHFHMGSWCSYLDVKNYTGLRSTPHKFIECGTAFCIGGYANLLRLREEKIDYTKVVDSVPANTEFYDQFADHEAAGAWLDLDDLEARELFTLENNLSFSMSDFDKLSEKDRADIAIDVLENLIKTGEVDWDNSLTKFGIEDDDIDP